MREKISSVMTAELSQVGGAWELAVSFLQLRHSYGGGGGLEVVTSELFGLSSTTFPQLCRNSYLKLRNKILN